MQNIILFFYKVLYERIGRSMSGLYIICNLLAPWGYTKMDFETTIMKRILFFAIVAFAALSMTACAGSQKHCAAYAKHDTGQKPDYKDVQ